MQRHKNTKSFSEIDSYCQDPSLLLNTFGHLLGQFDLRYINKLFSGAKKRGIAASKIFQTLFVLRFLDFSNVGQLMRSGVSKELSHKKDVFYGFLNNPNIPWRRITLLFFKQAYALVTKKTDGGIGGPVFLVLDDTLLGKTGRRMEFIGKVFDHCTHTYQLGMKLLTLGLCDGKSFLPMDFSVHNEPGKAGNRGLKSKELKGQFSKTRKTGSAGLERASEVPVDKITIALQMIGRCLCKWLKADYVLADSWFICEKFLKGIQQIDKGLHVIGLMKANRIVKVGEKSYRADKIPELKRRKIQCSRKFKCSYISLEMVYRGIGMRGYWIKMNGQGKWSLLISTNVKLTFCKAMDYYKNRWSIEVFFKDCKQNIGLGSCQSTNFDAHIATISIVFMNYTVLALKKRFEEYETLGILFRSFKQMMLQQTIVQKIWNILIQLFNSVFTLMGVDWAKFISTLINKEEEILKSLNDTLMPLYSSDQQRL